VTENGDPVAVVVVQSHVAKPDEIATVPHPVMVAAPYLKAIVPVAAERTEAVRCTTPPAVIELSALVRDGLAALLNPTTILIEADFVTPTVSVAITRIAYVPVETLDDAETTPELLIVIPETVEESETLATDHVQDEVEPVPPLIVGVEVFEVPKDVEIPGYEIEILG
jgi:hypothetical protein